MTNGAVEGVVGGVGGAEGSWVDMDGRVDNSTCSLWVFRLFSKLILKNSPTHPGPGLCRRIFFNFNFYFLKKKFGYPRDRGVSDNFF